MPAASGLGGGYYIDPFTGKRRRVSTKPTGAPTTSTAAARARQQAIAAQNEQYAPPGPSTSPTPTQLRTNSSQPVVNPFAQLAVTAGPPGADPYATYAANQQFQAASAAPANPATQAAAQAAGTLPSPQTGAANYNATTQLGKSYRDLMLPSAWDDPEALIDTFYRVYGIDKGSGDYGTQLESADNLGILYMLQNGEGAFGGNAHFVDWAAQRLMDQRRADGISDSPNALWQAMIDPSANSPLNYYLNNPSLTPEDQVNNFMSTMRYGLETTLPAPILNALMAQVDQMGREFRSLRNTSAGGASFTEYLNSRPGSLPAGW